MTANRTWTRRRMLQALSGPTILAGITGCLGDGGQGPSGGNQSTVGATSTAAETPGPFEDIAVDGRVLDIAVGSDSDVDQINLIGPDGELYKETRRARGETAVSFQLNPDYPTGELRILAIDSNADETVAETTLTVAPSLSMPTVRAVKEMDDPPEDVTHPNSQGYCTVENTGNGPAWINGYSTTGDPPFVVDNEGRGGIYTQNEELLYETEIGQNILLIPPGSTLSMYTLSGGFSVISDAIEENCSSEPQQEEFTFTVHQNTGESISEDLEYTYVMSEGEQECVVRDVTVIDNQ